MNQLYTHTPDALFSAWNEDRQTASPRSLDAWIAAYPDHADDFIWWATNAPLLDCATSAPVAPQALARSLAIGGQALAEFRAQYEAKAQTTPTASVAPTAAPLTSLYATARAQGLSPKTLAARLGVGLTTTAKLQSRLFRVASLPQELFTRLADALQVPVEQIAAYLNQPATLAPGAQYKSNAVPQVSAREDFLTDVENAADLTDAQKRFWREQASD